MAAPKRTKFQIEDDRREISRLYLGGWTQERIGRELGMTQEMVSYDLARIREQWRRSAIRNFDEARSEELAKIDNLELTYWRAWERSLEKQVSQVQYAKAGPEGQPTPTQAIIRTDPGLGDPRWLQGVAWCVERRCRLLGLDKPMALDLTSEGEKIRVREIVIEMPSDESLAIRE